MPESTPSPMPSGEPPFISVDYVRAALEAMIHAVPDAGAPNPIYFLLIIEELLANPDFPPASHLRVFVANQFLVELITAQFVVHRKVFNLPPPRQDETRTAALQAIQVDASKPGTELLGWSYTYYRYVRVDLALTLEEISSASAFHKRSLRRYHYRILERMTEKLIEAEKEARIRQRKRRLFALLPQVMPARLIGRDEMLNKVRHVLDSSGYHIYVTGSAGIGKSTLVQEIVRQQINTEEIVDLCWVRSPLSTQIIRQQIIQDKFPEGLCISLREYLMMWRTAIVLDDADALLQDLAALDDLLEYLSPAFVYIITRSYQPLSRIAVHIQLQPLTRSQTEELARYLATSEFDDFDEVCERTKGNPFAVRMLMRNPSYFETHDDGIVQQLLMTAYNSLAPDVKLSCLMLMLCPAGSVEISRLERLWDRRFNLEHIMTLAQRDFVELDSPDYVSLPTAVRVVLENFVRRKPEDMLLLRVLLDELESAFGYSTRDALPLVEHILLSGWLILDGDRREHWAELFAAEGVHQGHWAIWRAILESLSSHDPMLLIFYGICLRRLAEWDTAEEAFTAAIIEAGNKGMFIEQARALLELAVLLRYRGEYDRAIEEIERAQRTATQYRDTRLVNMVRLEQAQIAIDVGDGLLAQQLLTALPTTIRVLSLRSEAALLQKELDRSLVYAKNAIPLAADEKSTVGRLYALVGRVYDAKGELSSAKRYLSLAVTLLEQAQDIFALARAESNLAALLMRRNVYKEAEQLLLRAEKTQLLLVDLVALKTTQHNLQIVRLKLATK